MNRFRFEDALRLLVSYFPEETKKPALFHSIRVGTYLWHHNYSENIQIAGLLHDSLEDTDITEKQIGELFGEEVLNIVQANSEDSLVEKSKYKEDIVKRCSEFGESALIVKMADVYDNFLYYTKIQNISEIERCKGFARIIEKYVLRKKYNDCIFEKIAEINDYGV